MKIPKQFKVNINDTVKRHETEINEHKRDYLI